MKRAGVVLGLALTSAVGGFSQPATGQGLRLLAAEGLPAEHVALLMSDQQGGDLLFEQVASIVPLPDGTPALGFWLEVDADSLLLEALPERLFLKLTHYFLRDSSIVFAKSRAVEVVNPADLLEVDGLRLFGAIELEPGDYRFRALVSEPDSLRVGIREDVVRIPRGGGPIVSALQLDGVESRWLDLALDGPVPPANFFPSALAVLPVSESWSAEVLVVGVDDLAIENGSALGPDAVAAGSWSFEPGLDGWRVARTEVQVSPDLTGRFEVAPVAIPAGAGNHQNSGEVVVRTGRSAELDRGGVTEVLVSSQVTQPTSWTRLKRNTEIPTRVVDPTTRSGGRKMTVSKPEAREQLLELLRELASGEPTAEQDLARFEAEAAGGSSQALATLSEIELRAFDTIQQREPRAVIPILSMYLRRFRDHLSRQEYFLSTHCKRQALAIGDLLAARGTPEVAPAVADFFTAMGGLQVSGNDPAGAATLRTALRIDPVHSSAAEVLSWHLERDGRYEELVELVDSLQDPPPQVQLRRALSGLRLGRAGAWDQLASLAQQPDWVGELASQEMVRYLLASGNHAAAEEAVRRARARFPDNRKLILLTALTEDLAGRPIQSLESMAALGQATESGERHRYAGEPETVLDEARRRLDEFATDGADALRRVLRDLT